MKIKSIILSIFLMLVTIVSSNSQPREVNDGGFGPQPFVGIVENISRYDGSKIHLKSDPFSFISIASTREVNRGISGISFNLIRILDNAWLCLGEIGLRGTALPVVFLVASPERDLVRPYYKSGQYFSFPIDGDTGYIHISISEGSEKGEWIACFAVVTNKMFKEDPNLEQRYRYAGKVGKSDTPLFLSWTFKIDDE